MGTMNFSIPDDVKEAFNKVFEGENKSAIVSALMRKAIEEKERRTRAEQSLDALIDQLLRVRAKDPPLNDDDIRRLRAEGRP